MAQVTIGVNIEARELLQRLSKLTRIPQNELASEAIALLWRVKTSGKLSQQCSCGVGETLAHKHASDCPWNIGF